MQQECDTSYCVHAKLNAYIPIHPMPALHETLYWAVGCDTSPCLWYDAVIIPVKHKFFHSDAIVAEYRLTYQSRQISSSRAAVA